jgi:hypothetical protein
MFVRVFVVASEEADDDAVDGEISKFLKSHMIIITNMGN